MPKVRASRGQKRHARMGPNLPSNNRRTKLFHPHSPVPIFDILNKAIYLAVLLSGTNRQCTVFGHIRCIPRLVLPGDHGL